MRLSWVDLLLSMMLFPLPLIAGAQSGCRMLDSSPSVSAGTADYYIFDPVLRQTWSVVMDCQHPNWPPQAIESPASVKPSKSGMLAAAEIPSSRMAGVIAIVKPGTSVNLWSDSPARIRLSGMALEFGVVGQKIQVRVERLGTILSGIIDGPHSVRLVFSLSRGGNR
jgi:hypothetical protein